jgi:predicted ATPase
LSLPYELKYSSLTLSAEKQKQKTIEALAGVLVLITERQPVLLVLEDLHWMDASTLDALSFLIGETLNQRLMMLLTFRPEFVPSWDEGANICSLPLKHLSHSETKAIVAGTAHGKTLPRDVLNQIVQKTDGVPLFVEELTKTVLESDLLQEQGTSYELTGTIPILAIPTTLHDSLIARLDRLAGVKEIAQLGATLSRKFDYTLIEAVSPWDTTTLQNGLGQLVAAGLLFQQGTLPLASYEFKHALIQDAAYQSLLKGRRQQYHRRIAKVLEGISSVDIPTRSELLAHHYSEAGLFEEAIAYWQIAGQRDLEQAANQEAIAHFTRGLDLLKKLPKSSERDRQELEMQLGLAPAYMAIKGWAAVEVEQASQRARELSEKLNDGQLLYTALWSLWTNYFLRGQIDESYETAEAVLKMAQRTDNPILHVSAHHAVGFSHYFRGAYDQAREHAEIGINHFDLNTERVIVKSFQLSSTMVMMSFLATSLWMLGYSEQSEQMSRRAFLLSDRIEHSPSKAYLMAFTLYFYHLLRNSTEAATLAARLKALAEQEGFLLWIGLAKQFQGWDMAEKGQVHEGIEFIRDGIELWQGSGTCLCVPQSLVMLAECLIKDCQLEAALNVVNDGIYQATTRHEHHCEPEFYRLQGEICVAKAVLNQNNSIYPINLEPESLLLLREAEESFQRSLVLAHEQGALMLELRTALRLSRVWQQQSKQAEAYELLSGLYSCFTEGLNSPDLSEASILLQELSDVL